MSLVWELDLPDSEKLVLLALADCANDEGHCWPGMTALTRKCSKSDRTIQLAIKMLVVKGHLTRREVAGKGCNYTVHPIVKFAADPRSDDTPEATTPPKGTTETPEAASGKPSRTTNSEAKASSSVGKHLIPADWTAPAKSALPPRARACAEQWTEASYQTEAEAFVCYWRSERKMKTDWTGTWANRIIAQHSKVVRDQKFGNAAPEVKRGWNDLSRDERIAQTKESIAFYSRINRPAEIEECRRRLAKLEGEADPAIVNMIDRVAKARAA